MGPTFFDTPGKLAALHAECERWFGTPWFPNSCSPGPRGGVSCHQLPGAIYRALGVLDCAIPEGSPGHTRHSAESLITPWLDARPEFVRLSNLSWFNLASGDLLGFRIGPAVHHLGILLDGQSFIHAITKLGTIRSPLQDATWLSRFAAAWRPVAPHL